MVPEAAQVAGLGENSDGVGRPDARHGHKSQAVKMIFQQERRLLGDLLTQPIC